MTAGKLYCGSLLFLLLAGNLPAEDAGKTAGLDVTFISHEGFLVRAAGKKVMTEAAFDPGVAAKLGPPAEVLAMIAEARAPFDGIDVIVVTHKDRDHFDPASAIGYLRKSPKSRLIAHTQVVDLMRPVDGFAEVADRVHEAKLEAGARERVSHNGITIDAICLSHEHRPQVSNLVFVVELGGARFLRMGDGFFGESEAHLKSYPFEQTPIDVLFLNQYDRSAPARALVAERIKPAHIVAMHASPEEMTTVPDSIRAAYPDVVLFEKPMERRVFTRMDGRK